MKHRVKVTRHTPFDLSPKGYVRFQVHEDETGEVIGTLEVRKDGIAWRPAEKELWLERSWEQLTRQWKKVGPR